MGVHLGEQLDGEIGGQRIDPNVFGLGKPASILLPERDAEGRLGHLVSSKHVEVLDHGVGVGEEDQR